MNKLFLTFGLISGVVSSVLMLSRLPLLRQESVLTKEAIVGYSGMVVAFRCGFLGSASYRENVGDGQHHFWQGA